MLREIPEVEQVPGEPRRRWFASAYFDLVVWSDDAGRTVGFHLYYDRGNDERVCIWDADDGSGGRARHRAVDSGDQPGRMKMTPLITHAVAPDVPNLAERFRRESANLDAAVAATVLRA